MTREIDTEGKLSNEDAIYLSDRGRLTAEQEAKYGIKPLPKGGTKGVPEDEQADNLPENTGDVNTATVTTAEASPGEGTEAPYEEWSKSDLQDEAEARGLSKSGTVAELAQRLEENDNEG